MARPINTVAAQAELETIGMTIATLETMNPLPGCQIKTVKPAGTAGKPSHMRGYARLIYPAGHSRSITSQDVPRYQQRIDAARELKRLEKRRSVLLAKLQGCFILRISELSTASLDFKAIQGQGS